MGKLVTGPRSEADATPAQTNRPTNPPISVRKTPIFIDRLPDCCLKCIFANCGAY